MAKYATDSEQTKRTPNGAARDRTTCLQKASNENYKTNSSELATRTHRFELVEYDEQKRRYCYVGITKRTFSPKEYKLMMKHSTSLLLWLAAVEATF